MSREEALDAIIRHREEQKALQVEALKCARCGKPRSARATYCRDCYNELSRQRRDIRSVVDVDAFKRDVGECEVCGAQEKLVADHDHATGRLRGVLCSNCNTSLGLLREDPVLMLRLALYLHVRATDQRRQGE